MADKQKLTLSVDKEVIEKARELDLNISEITENVLKSFVAEPDNEGDAEVAEKYKELFKTIQPVLKKFNTSVLVAENTTFEEKLNTIWEEKLFLGYNSGLFIVDPSDEGHDFKTIDELKDEDFSKFSFNSPGKILSDLVKQLAESVENNKKLVKELEVTKRIVEVISQSLLKKRK